jgi:carboxyl-terminal processing protease
MNSSNRSITLLVAGVLFSLATGIFVGMRLITSRSEDSAYLPQKLRSVFSLVESQYVDPIDMDSVTEKLLPMLTRELDPHSVYIPARDMQATTESLDGEFDGVGIIFNMMTDTAVVLNVISGGPSDRAGVRNGDRIILIDDSLVAGRKIDQNQIMKRLRGKRGTKVDLKIRRAAVSDLVPVTVTRGVITIKSIDASFIVQPGVGYIKLLSFSRNSHGELLRSIDELKKAGMQSLIFDLRGNTGGYLDQAILIANELLGQRQLIVYTVDRLGRRVEEYSNGRGRLSDIRLAVLVDEGSASSSEILAGAIQDNDRGVVIGRRTFGKGLVQKQFSFNDGSALRLTIARYYTPTGRSIQKPYSAGDEEAYGNDIINRFNHREFFSADSIKFTDSLRFVTPKGKVVYGGGGIMPDVFVPLDTTGMSRYYIEVVGRNVLFRYTLAYADRHRAELDAIESVEQLRAFVDRDRGLFDDFLAYAERNGVRRPSASDLVSSRSLITAQLRAHIGRNTPLEDNGFCSLIWPEDRVMVRAVEEMSR